MLAGALSAAVAPVGCSTAEPPPLDEEAQVEPYNAFFKAMRGEAIYLFANLDDLQDYDQNPRRLTYVPFIDRSGNRVFVAADPELVPRIVKGYEREVDTALVPAGDLSAPPPRAAAADVPTTQAQTLDADTPEDPAPASNDVNER